MVYRKHHRAPPSPPPFKLNFLPPRSAVQFRPKELKNLCPGSKILFNQNERLFRCSYSCCKVIKFANILLGSFLILLSPIFLKKKICTITEKKRTGNKLALRWKQNIILSIITITISSYVIGASAALFSLIILKSSTRKVGWSSQTYDVHLATSTNHKTNYNDHSNNHLPYKTE